MNIDQPEIRNFMQELLTRTEGDPELQVSMYDVGEVIGLEKHEVSSISQELMIEEWIELKTLSGGISITEKGLQALGVTGKSARDQDAGPRLSNGQVADEQDRSILQDIINTVRASTLQSVDYPLLEEIVIDIKTLETQLLSPQPKMSIIREIVKSLAGLLAAADLHDLGSRLKHILGDN